MAWRGRMIRAESSTAGIAYRIIHAFPKPDFEESYARNASSDNLENGQTIHLAGCVRVRPGRIFQVTLLNQPAKQWLARTAFSLPGASNRKPRPSLFPGAIRRAPTRTSNASPRMAARPAIGPR